jgi:hypothetical protein
MAVVSAFNKEAEYPDKPLDLTAKEDATATTNTAVNTEALRFSAWSKVFNQNFIQQHPEVADNPESQ